MRDQSKEFPQGDPLYPLLKSDIGSTGRTHIAGEVFGYSIREAQGRRNRDGIPCRISNYLNGKL
jgi:hypothetical protein